MEWFIMGHSFAAMFVTVITALKLYSLIRELGYFAFRQHLADTLALPDSIFLVYSALIPQRNTSLSSPCTSTGFAAVRHS